MTVRSQGGSVMEQTARTFRDAALETIEWFSQSHCSRIWQLYRILFLKNDHLSERQNAR